MTRLRPALSVVFTCVALAVGGCASGGGHGGSPRPTSPAKATDAGGPGAALGSVTVSNSWPTYHGESGRSGYSSAMPAAKGAPRVTTSLKLDGSVYASPVVIGSLTVVATENDTVYGFNSRFRIVWKAHLGRPATHNDHPCGDIDPLGITGTPIYSPTTKLIYAVIEVGPKIRHQLVALSASTGHVVFRRALDLAGADPTYMQQRGALAIAGNRVWVPFGALTGDCGNYKGRVVAVPANGKGKLLHFDPSTRRQGGIWNVAGGTVDAQGHLYFVSANGSSFPGDRYDHTNSVNEITSTGKLIDSFAPKDWAQNNQGDVGLGSNGVSLVGKSWLVLGGKSGPVYVLRRGHLGGINGQRSVRTICKVFGGSAVVGSVVYLPCSDTGNTAVRVNPSGTLSVLWRAAGNIHGSPVVGGGRVWSLDQNGTLYALDPRTGKSHGSVSVGATSRFATPSIAGRSVLVPTLTGLVVVRTS